MRHLVPFRVYESKTPSGLTKKQEAFLNRYTEGTWRVNPTTGLVDIQGDFYCVNRKAKSFFGVKFGNVTGDFACYGNKLQSLEGAPQKVVGNFDCIRNELQSLEGAPREVNGNFYCGSNELQSLAGAPREVGGDFYCSGNQLQSLEGAPKEINGNFYCDELWLYLGEWNMEGWLEVLRTGNEQAKKLILTLPILNPTYWNSRISENPESTILELSEFWDDMPEKVKNSIRIPSELREDFDNLLDLVRAGIM